MPSNDIPSAARPPSSDRPQADSTTTVSELKELIGTFVAERNWEEFHTPKNLVMALSIEVAELMEHFQWATPEESNQVAADPRAFSNVCDELADVVGYALEIANRLQIDVTTAMQRKMVKNRAKYPIQ